MVRLKDERYDVVKDAEGLRRGRRYDVAFSTQIGTMQSYKGSSESPIL